jgi:hypothetical protein
MSCNRQIIIPDLSRRELYGWIGEVQVAYKAYLPSSRCGVQSSDPQINPAEIFKKWEAERYHEPGDGSREVRPFRLVR